MLSSKARQSIVGKIKHLVASSGFEPVAIEGKAVHHPTFNILHPEIGLVAIEVGGQRESESMVRARLNDKVTRLLNEANHLNPEHITRVSVVTAAKSSVKRVGPRALILSADMLESFDWAGEVGIGVRDGFDGSQLVELLNPRFVIEVPRYEGVLDPDRNARHLRRVELDKEQAAIAARAVDDILIVAGGPGTGKTLVLLGRAKWLARQHPEWKILLIVYNNMLLKHLRSVPDMPDSVRIVTLKRFLEVRGVRPLSTQLMRFDDPEVAEKSAAEFVRSLKLEDDDVDIDALLVDEWQDFRAPYLSYLLSLVRPGRGGAMFAGDEKQAIYTDGYADPFKGRHVENVSLSRPYRSTRQILTVAAALDRKFKIDHLELAPDGEPVTAIYAPHWSQQGDVIALEIKTLLQTGGRLAGEIAVLCTTKSGANHVATSLARAGIGYRLLTRFWEDPEPAGDAVNIMTVHGGKGYDFDVVFIQGFETLKDRDGTAENAMWRRVGFVGVTRPHDLLYIVYKEPTQFVSSILELGKSTSGMVVGRIYPEHYREMLSE